MANVVDVPGGGAEITLTREEMQEAKWFAGQTFAQQERYMRRIGLDRLPGDDEPRPLTREVWKQRWEFIDAWEADMDTREATAVKNLRNLMSAAVCDFDAGNSVGLGQVRDAIDAMQDLWLEWKGLKWLRQGWYDEAEDDALLDIQRLLTTLAPQEAEVLRLRFDIGCREMSEFDAFELTVIVSDDQDKRIHADIISKKGSSADIPWVCIEDISGWYRDVLSAEQTGILSADQLEGIKADLVRMRERIRSEPLTDERVAYDALHNQVVSGGVGKSPDSWTPVRKLGQAELAQHLDANYVRALDDVSKQLGVTPDQVRATERAALRKLWAD
jgi:hypothetical protein